MNNQLPLLVAFGIAAALLSARPVTAAEGRRQPAPVVADKITPVEIGRVNCRAAGQSRRCGSKPAAQRPARGLRGGV